MGKIQKEMDQIATQYQFPLDYLFSTLDPDEVSRAEQKNQPTIAG